MPYKRRLTVIAIITYLLLIPLVAYFKYFPTIINSESTNILIVLLVFLLTSLLVYGAFIIKKSTDIYFLLPQSLIFAFIARAIPNLRLSYPPLHDPYYHYVCTLNVLEYGTLKPVLGWWYSGVNTQLHWPDMHLLTTVLVHITDIDVMQVFRFQEPAMGMVFFLAVFILAKAVTKNDGIAMLSALFASLTGVAIFYQSEYHPQGLAIIFLILLLYAFIKSRSRLINNIYFRYVALIFCITFVLSHYFTPLFLALIFIMYLMVLLMVRTLSSYAPIKDKLYKIAEDIESDYTFFIVVIISSLAYHFIVYTSAVDDFIRLVGTESAPQAHLVSIGQPDVPLLNSVLNSSKWGLFILAVISILWIIKTKNTNEFRLAALFICIVFAGVIGNYVIASPLDRLICFYIPFAAVFGSLTLFRFSDEWFGSIQKNRKVILAVLIASILITAGFFNSQTPAYFFQDSEINTYYWYSNRLPKMEEYKTAGEWIDRYTTTDSTYNVDFHTRTIPFYYGKRPYQQVGVYFPTYIVINPQVLTPNESLKLTYLNVIYDDVDIRVYTRI